MKRSAARMLFCLVNGWCCSAPGWLTLLNIPTIWCRIFSITPQLCKLCPWYAGHNPDEAGWGAFPSVPSYLTIFLPLSFSHDLQTSRTKSLCRHQKRHSSLDGSEVISQRTLIPIIGFCLWSYMTLEPMILNLLFTSDLSLTIRVIRKFSSIQKECLEG